MNNPFMRMYQHMAWADRQIISAIESRDYEIDKAVVLLGHVVAAEYIWLSRIEKKELVSFGPWTKFSIQECSRLLSENNAGYLRVIQNLTDEVRMSIIEYRTTKGDAMETSLGDILLHVCLHGAYHRGQISAILKSNGVSPPSTDYILYCRQL